MLQPVCWLAELLAAGKALSFMSQLTLLFLVMMDGDSDPI